MSALSITIALPLSLSLITSGPLPDELDLLKSINRQPQVAMLLDHSCSMRNGSLQTSCVYYAAAHNGGPTNINLNKNKMMKAALTGCSSNADGVLDKWNELVNFAILQFPAHGFPWGVRASFDSSLSSLEAAVMGVATRGATPMTPALDLASQYFNAYFSDSNSLSCRPNYVVLLSDGNPWGGASNTNFSNACDGSSLNVSRSQPWVGADYLANNGDQLCSVSQTQNIQTYTIGFGASGSFNESNLQKIASRGGGSYHYAADVAQLDDAFSTIIQEIVDRSAVFYSSPATQRDGLFAGNYMYVSSYRPESEGLWKGNVKKQCIFPRKLANSTKYDPNDLSCFLSWNAQAETFYTNPSVQDQWTPGTSTTTADVGGAGQIMLCGSSNGCSDGLGLPGQTPNTPYYPRNIITWRDNAAGYVKVALGGGDPWTSADAWVSGSARAQLINYLHGYTYDSDTNGNPVAVREWPIGDFVHSPTALLKFGDCERTNNCWVVTAANDGMIHFFDAADGTETTALIPAQFWKPDSVTKNIMAVVNNQPVPEMNHRYYADGGMRLYHRDANTDGVIDATEKASLIFGLGRGGRAYYSLEVSQLQQVQGRLNAARTPIRPLIWDAGTEFSELRDTWASPWIGQVRNPFQTSQTIDVAIFPSGHIAEHDDPDVLLPGPATKAGGVSGTPVQLTCPQASSQMGLPPFCGYVGSGYADPTPLDFTTGIYGLNNAVAYRVRFDLFDLDPNDTLYIQDGQGSPAAALTGTGQSANTWSDGLDSQGWSPWIYSSNMQIRVVTNGQATFHRGFTVDMIEYMQASQPVTEPHYPTIYVVGMEEWNDSANEFRAGLVPGAPKARLTRLCTGGPNCFDSNHPKRTDLKHMTCAISTEVSVFTVAEKMSAMYWPDECGQIFKAWHDGSDWNARRLLYTNDTPSMVNNGLGKSKHFRKIFNRLDLVPSTCPGQKVTAVYFGTGNLQRPGAKDELEGAPANGTPGRKRDVVGVIWDDGQIQNLSLEDLADVTEQAEINPLNNGKGWFWRLGPDEKSLRRPLVFQGTAYWKTYQPTTSAAECQSASGVDRIYAVNNCSARAMVDDPLLDPTDDRKTWEGATDIGSEILMLSPENGAPIVTHANAQASQSASLVPAKATRKIPFIYHWRIPRDD